MHFATTNIDKFNEVKAKLTSVEVERLNLEYPELQVSSLEEVVEYALQWINERGDNNVMIEDSGLFIDALNGFPGPYSSYVFKSIGCEGVVKLVEGLEDRNARFQSCIGIILDGESTILNGHCQGTISLVPKGHGGFGFDPIFVPKGHERTFAEMGIEEKNGLSHRGKALEELTRFLDQLKGI